MVSRKLRVRTTSNRFASRSASCSDDRQRSMRFVIGIGLVGILGCIAAPGQTRPVPLADDDARRGMVVLQFDDGTSTHYTNAFPILEKYGLKGSFGVVTGRIGRPGKLTPEQVKELQRAGHEIHDHTLNHDARFWGVNIEKDRTGVPREWEAEIRQSLANLTRLGITTRGWNQPGGEGELWTPELRDVLAKHYDYVAGRVDLPKEQNFNFHWNMRDDPLSAGRVLPTTDRTTADDINSRLASGVARGLVCVALHHVVAGADVGRLEQLCGFISANRIANLRMADAVQRVNHTREWVSPLANQAPNARFEYDLDANGRPDGWDGCTYAPASVSSPKAGARVARVEVAQPAETIVYGPEIGPGEFRLFLRAANGKSAKVKVELVSMNLGDRIQPNGVYAYSRQSLTSNAGWTVGGKWKQMTQRLSVPERSDRVIVRISASDATYIAYPEWRKQGAGAKGNR